MMTPVARIKQSGAVLIVSLIMLVLITLTVVTSYNFSTTNLQAVGNMQFRQESIIAANMATEIVTSSAFTNSPAAQEIVIDIDDDGTNDYTVAISAPNCEDATALSSSSPSSISLPNMSSDATWNTLWKIEATVTDANSGASVKIVSGIRTVVNQTTKETNC